MREIFKFSKHEKMISIATVLAFLMVAAGLSAQTWHTANQSTVAWDAVTTNTAGDPIPADAVVKYTVYLANANTDPGKSNPALIAESITETQYTFTLGTQGKFVPGVKSELWVDGVKEEESVIAWTDDPQYAQGDEGFGLRYFLPPKAPGGLRPM